MVLAKYKFDLTNSLQRMLKNDEQVESVKESLQYSRRYLNVLVARFEKDLADKVKEDENMLNYDNANWHLLQAERLGYRRALRKMIDTIGPIEEK